MKLLAFSTEVGELAVPIGRVDGVRLASGIIPVPAPKDNVVGLLAVDGATVTVVAPFGERSKHLLLLSTGEGRFGLMVGEVTGIVEVDERAVESAPAGQRSEVVAGVVATEDGVTMIIDVDQVGKMLRA